MFHEFISINEIFAVLFVGCLWMHCVLLSMNPEAVTINMVILFKFPAMAVTWVTIDLLFYHLRPDELHPDVFTALKIGYIASLAPYIWHFWGYVSDKGAEYAVLFNPELKKYLKK